jgi:hypothetical protein
MSDFQPARNFNQLAALGKTITTASGKYWFSVFRNEEDALSFARYTGGFARRVVSGATTRSTAEWSDAHGGYLPILSIQFPGWGREEGLILCESEQVAGIALRDARAVLLPVKQHRYTACTESGSLYIGFTDGTAFCRSKSDGALQPGTALYFCSSSSDAERVQNRGGELRVESQPRIGLYPVYVHEGLSLGTSRQSMSFPKGAFRLGTRIIAITPAKD